MRNYNRIAKLILMFSIVMFIPELAKAQLANEYSNWAFYENYKLNFNKSNNNVSLKRINFKTPLSCSSISNKNGELLLTANYNSITSYLNDTIVQTNNINNLSYSGTNQNQGSLILPLLSKENNYIVFHTVDSSWNKIENTFLNYTIIETNPNSTFKIISGNNIVRYNVRDQIASFFNYQDSSFTFVITNWQRDTIFSYKCNKYGVISLLDQVKQYVTISKDKYGNIIKDKYQVSLKISPNGRYIALASQKENFFNLIQFNPISGKFGKLLTMSLKGLNPNVYYDGTGSCEFSSNSNYLYFSNNNNNIIYQYDVSIFNQDIINSSKVPYEISSNLKFKNMLLGADDKIYIRTQDQINSIAYQSFAVIENSNKHLNETNISFNKIMRDTLLKYADYNYMYLPNIPANSYFPKYNTQFISSNAPTCLNDNVSFNVTFFGDTSKIDCSWYGPNGFTSKAKNPKFVYNSESQNGWYYLKTIHNVSGFENLDSILIQNYRINPTKIISNKPTKICDGDTITLSSSIVASTVQDKNIWTSKALNTPRIMENIQVYKTAWYYLKSVDENGCTTYDSIYLEFLPRPKAEIGVIGSLSICQGDSVKLYIKNKSDIVDYVWEFNNSFLKEDTIIAKTPQKYKLIATNKTLNSCTDKEEIEVTEQINEKLVISGAKSFCEGDSTKLEITKLFPGVQFEWNTGEQGTNIIAKKAGSYWCRATNNNCLKADTIQISLFPKPVLNITGDTLICKDGSVVLALNGTYSSCTWSNGDTTTSISVNKAGIYTAQAENQFGCRSIAQIEVKEISNNIDMSKFQDIDFGNVQINDSSTKEIDLTGFSSINFKLKIGKDYSIVRIGDKIEIKYKARYSGLSEDSLFFEFTKPCLDTIGIKLSAIAEGDQIIALKVADIEVLAGDTNVLLPITYKLNDKIYLPQTITWTAKLNYKSAVYFPDITRDVQSANRKIEVILSGTKTLINREDTLTIIKGKTYLADTIYAKINFSDFTVSPNFTNLKEDGSIKIVGLCAPNLRPIEFFTPTTLKIKPNPSNGKVEIEFSSDTKAETILKIRNLNGAEVFTETKMKDDVKLIFQYDNLNLPSGSYQVQIIQFGKVVKSARLFIEK